MNQNSAPRRIAGRDYKDLRCVIADTNRVDRLLARTAITMLGVPRVEEVSDLRSLRKALQTQGTSLLLISDELSEEASTLEVVRRLRWSEEPGDPEMAILFAAPEEARDETLGPARNAGVDAVVSKPFSAQMLWRTVDQTLTSPRPFIHAETYRGPCRRICPNPLAPTQRRADDQA